ncbi:hypothetical protein K4K95_02385 [Phaeobacter inhibens]|uniref:hypothetical protein n=1 Tax=Phaeobacter inhibens TaxID=221822 RepID=UPI0021A400CE|nr:hypothetical protein [Phaeobacter inhibens]UWR69047.1 hypothetical protein K4K95_02385 [Phaeobacter inhibens]
MRSLRLPMPTNAVLRIASASSTAALALAAVIAAGAGREQFQAGCREHHANTAACVLHASYVQFRKNSRKTVEIPLFF